MLFQALVPCSFRCSETSLVLSIFHVVPRSSSLLFLTKVQSLKFSSLFPYQELAFRLRLTAALYKDPRRNQGLPSRCPSNTSGNNVDFLLCIPERYNVFLLMLIYWGSIFCKHIIFQQKTKIALTNSSRLVTAVRFL